MSRHLRLTEDQLRAFLDRGQRAQAAVDELGAGKPEPGADMAAEELPPSRMNRTEAAYALELEARRSRGELAWFGFEAIKLRLADRTFYTPDFAVLADDYRLEFHEVKGFWRDDARVKIKVAAELFPFRFQAVTKIPRRKGGGWHVEHFRKVPSDRARLLRRPGDLTP